MLSLDVTQRTLDALTYLLRICLILFLYYDVVLVRYVAVVVGLICMCHRACGYTSNTENTNGGAVDKAGYITVVYIQRVLLDSAQHVMCHWKTVYNLARLSLWYILL